MTMLILEIKQMVKELIYSVGFSSFRNVISDFVFNDTGYVKNKL